MGKVYIGRCEDYSEENINNALLKCFENLGGVGEFIKPGMKVLVKPNLVLAKRPEDAATTHPALVKGVVGIAERAGAAKVTVADSPGGLYKAKLLKGLYTICGLTKACGANLNYDTSSVDVHVPEGKLIKKTIIISPAAEADLIINLPKLKTHGQMVYSGAVKNMFGAVPGVLKAEYHFRMPDYMQFAEALLDVYLSVKPGLNIMDAVWGMDGEGPTSGDPKYMGMLIAGSDALETDLTALKLIGIKPDDVPYMKAAIGRGLCPAAADSLELVGDEIGKMSVGDFKAPALEFMKTIKFFDKGIMRHAINALKPKPVFNSDKCVRCGDCSRICPAGVIDMKEGLPKVDLSKCIRCFCCHEFCRFRAVEIKRSLIIKMVSGKTKVSQHSKQ